MFWMLFGSKIKPFLIITNPVCEDDDIMLKATTGHAANYGFWKIKSDIWRGIKVISLFD